MTSDISSLVQLFAQFGPQSIAGHQVQSGYNNTQDYAVANTVGNYDGNFRPKSKKSKSLVTFTLHEFIMG